jgi:hypothetical protein
MSAKKRRRSPDTAAKRQRVGAHHPYQLQRTVHNDDVATPDDLFEVLDERFHFTFDPCPLNGLTNGMPSGLEVRWGASNFVNPPYSNIAPWLRKALEERRRYGSSSVFLIPAQTFTSYWTSYVWRHATELVFIENRVRFKNYPRTFPSPMVCVVFAGGRDAPHAHLEVNRGYRLRCFSLNATS